MFILSTNTVWRLLPYDVFDSAMNMALDEAILIAHSEGKVPATLRFYGWNPATISLGYFQRVNEIRLDALEAMGWGFVRRMTGGRAVLHDQELTYSIIASEKHPLMTNMVTETYQRLSQGLLRGYQNLGLQAELSPPQKEHKNYQSAACFDSPSDYELLIHGKKAAGSAQVRQRGVVLQHGSILLELEVDKWFEVLHFHTEEEREKMKKEYEKKAVSIRQCTDQPIDIQQVERAFTIGFQEGLGLDLEMGTFTSYEMKLAQQLVAEKYNQTDWNFRR